MEDAYLVEFENKANVSDFDFYPDIYSNQLKMHIVKFDIDE
jgi:hypothetical protein